MSSSKNDQPADILVAREDGLIVPSSQVHPNFVLPDSKEPGKDSIRFECNYVMVDPDDDSATDTPTRYPSHPPIDPEHGRPTNSKQVSLCGLSPDITSSMVHGIFAVSATSMGKKVPMRTNKSKSKPSEHTQFAPYRTDKQVRFCGLDSSTSARLVKQLFAAGAKTLVDPDRLCRRTTVGTSSRHPPVPPLSPNRPKECTERRVVSIATDLNNVAPKMVKRENIVHVLKESEKKYREKKTIHRRLKRSKAPVKKVEFETTSEESETFDGDDNSEYPSDIDEFLEFAKVVVEEQNKSFDSDSFRDFESVLQESIQSHFLDDEDVDSLDSDSTYSGYDPESNYPKRHLEENMLASESTRRRIRGNIARKKDKKRRGSDSNAVPELSDSQPSDLSSMVQKNSFSRSDAESNGNVASAWTDAIIRGKYRLKKSGDVSPDDSYDDSLTRMNISGITDLKNCRNSKSNTSTPGSERSRTIPSFQESSVSQVFSNRTSESDSENTVTTGTSWTAIGQQLRRGNTRVLEKYAIDPQDNSVISDTPYKPPRRIRKRRQRKKQVKIITDDEPFDDFDKVEETVNSLASLLTDENTSVVNREAVMAQLRDVAPDLYGAVVAKIESSCFADVTNMDALPNEPITSESSTPRKTESGLKEVVDDGAIKDQTNVKISCCTPDKVYWADDSHCEDEGVLGLFHFSGADSPPQVDLPCDLSSIAQQENSINNLPSLSEVPPTLESVLEAGQHDSPLKQGGLQNNASSDICSGQVALKAMQPHQENIAQVCCDVSPKKTKMDPPEGDQTSFLEEFIEDFLTEKFQSMNVLAKEKDEMAAKKQQVINQLKSAGASIVPLDSTEAMLQSENLLNDARTPASPALANRLERKRKALILARRRRFQAKLPMQDMTQDNQMAGESEKVSTSSSSTSSPGQRVGLPTGSRNNQQLEELTSSLSEELRSENPSKPQAFSENKSLGHPEREQPFQFHSNMNSIVDASKIYECHDRNGQEQNLMDSRSPTLTATRNAIQRVRAKRKKILGGKNPVKATTGPTKMALLMSMDNSENDSEGTLQVGSHSIAFKSPRKHSIKYTARGKRRLSSYEVLSEQETVNASSPGMKSQDILRAFLPPSPESPTSDYRLAYSSSGNPENDLLPQSGGSSMGERTLFHDGSKKSVASFAMHIDPVLGDPFDDIVHRSITNHDAVTEGDAFVNIQKKSSPTSVVDFFNPFNPEKPCDSLGFVDDGEIDPVFLDDDDRFVQRSVGMMLGEEEGLIEANFMSTTQFEV